MIVTIRLLISGALVLVVGSTAAVLLFPVPTGRHSGGQR